MYLLDANIFIQANRAHYGLDFVPAFWNWLDLANSGGIARSIHKVGGEIAAGTDNLTAWAGTRSGLFLPMDAACIPSLRTVANWANSGWFTQAAVSEFLSAADYELVAYAHAYGHTVVTMEKPEPNRKSRVKIPDACIAHGVSWMSPFDMLRKEHAQFVLSGTP
ncbi:DUF4411 family protein [Cryobacterium sp. Y57]|uniref:DUF4411 family protein n=1 Tax=Cryobacterium sp. Y57 TaxID=2048287 RepID=UPI000CE4D408|nr:DUF4411 family protein [Cryobacterium sp. Y57]